jgi:signal recognition particle receptor subunit beta
VVDSSDTDRMEEAKEELARLLQEDELRDACVLVFANKQDLPGALSVKDVAKSMGMDKQRNRQ